MLYKAEVQKKYPDAFCKIEPVKDKFDATLYLFSVYLEKDEDVFMATYGDGLANININDLLKFHKKMGKMCTITGLNPFSKYGVLDVSEGVVTKFREKPILKDLINGGFMVFNKEIFNFIKKDEDCMLEDTTLPKLAEKGEVALYKHEGFWHCMDTYKHFKQLNKMWAEKPEWKIW